MAFVHGAVSVGSPSQAAAEGALLQLRDLNLLPPDQDGSHSDHLPHSDQVPTPAEMKNGRSAWVGSDVLQMRWYSMACVVWYFMGPPSENIKKVTVCEPFLALKDISHLQSFPNLLLQ